MRGYCSVYLAKREDGIYKIGVSEAPEYRMKELYFYNKMKHELVSHLQFVSVESCAKVSAICFKIEAGIKREFADYVASGREWLKLNEDQVETINIAFRKIRNRYNSGCTYIDLRKPKKYRST